MKILSFGSLNIDHVYQVDHFVRPGETMTALDYSIECGGKGLNQSIALAKAGAEVYHAGMVGESHAQMLVDALKQANVNTDHIKTLEKIPTGHAIIQVNREGQNCIMIHGGANTAMTREHIDSVIACFGQGDFLLLQNEISEIPYIVTQASKQGLKIVLNPSPFNQSINEIPLDLVDYFILNEVEAADISGVAVADALAEMKKTYQKAKILITLGSEGSLYFDGEKEYTQKAYKVEAVDTTAAGDTFTGYFLASHGKGESVETSLDLASRASSIAVTRHGASVSIPTYDELK